MKYEIIVTFTDGINTTTQIFYVQITSNPTPIINLSKNKSELMLGDTLKVTLYASDDKPLFGVLDFGDETVIYFTKEQSIIDTTFAHVYTYPQYYNITARFDDGFTSASKQTSVLIVTNYYFSMSLSVGMVWRYWYNYYYRYEPESTLINQSGINDTLHFKGHKDGRIVDTTYIINNTLQLEIVLSYSTVMFNIPLYDRIQIHKVPNHVYIERYTIYVDNYGPGSDAGGASYNTNGLLSYYYYRTGSHGFAASETMTLLEFIKP